MSPVVIAARDLWGGFSIIVREGRQGRRGAGGGMGIGRGGMGNRGPSVGIAIDEDA